MYKRFYFVVAWMVLPVSFCPCKGKSFFQQPPKSHVLFKVDERTEFFRTLFNLATEDEVDEDMKPCETDYYQEVKQHFDEFKNHPLISYIRDNENIKIDFSAVGLMFYGLQDFEFNDAYSKELASYGITKAQLDSLRPALQDFYAKSGFHAFFNSHQNYYEKALAPLKKEVDTENLLEHIQKFYQSSNQASTLTVFVELTNNANNKAVTFYNYYDPNSRAVILANVCDDPNRPTAANLVLALDDDIRGILYHEVSHLFTNQLLDRYIGDLKTYEPVCEGCSAIEVEDKVDHLIVFPLQAVLLKRLNGNSEGEYFYLNECQDVRKDIYERLSRYDPEGDISFEKVYSECIEMIKTNAAKN